jgi:prepilin-type N-terminal cleavage/methylation domain-containing protein
LRVESLESRVESQSAEQVPRLNGGGARQRIGSQRSTLNAQPFRGLTLVELLIVIIILSTLVSAAIPILAPTNDDRRLREATRGANSFISAAQMRAIQLQRPFGVAIKRLSQDTNTSGDPDEAHDDNAVSVEMFYVEQPAPYRGYDRTSGALVARHTVPAATGEVLIRFVLRGTDTPNDGLPTGWDADLFPPGVIRPGDVIEIDGTRYELLAPHTAAANVVVNTESGFYQAPASGVVTIEGRPTNDTGQMLNVDYDAYGRKLRDPLVSGPATRDAPYWTNAAPYKILRQPMPTSDEPFQFPEGTAIDLRASGLTIEFRNNTATNFFYDPEVLPPNNEDRVDNGEPVTVMFTPEGSVERLRLNAKNVADTSVATPAPDEIFDERPTSNIYLLVGRRENAPPPVLEDDASLDVGDWGALTTEQQRQDAKETVNWLRGESRWIVIGSQSGRVATVENAFVDPARFFVSGPPIDYGSEPKDARRARQIDAAREFAREMVQAGGR